ncbi:MAG TPA: biotin transporter BioY [Bacillales bacterium]
MTNTKRKWQPIDLAYAGMFAALMAIGANLTSMITFGAIPLTMQTFFAIMAGALLGSRLGATSMLVYMIVGLIGVPVFAGFSGGPGTIFSQSFGFIISFIFVAYVTGKIIEAKPHPGLPRFFAACFVGLFLNYAIGTTIMYFALNFWVAGSEAVPYFTAWAFMLPFLPKDILFTIIAAVIAPRIYQSVRKSSRYRTAA